MSKMLIMITDAFPFGKGEIPFIVPELPFLLKTFQVKIISKSNDARQTTALPTEIEVKRCPSIGQSAGWEKFQYTIRCLWDPMFLHEAILIFRQGHQIFGRLLHALKYNAYAIKIAEQVQTLIASSNQEEIYLYSYWYNQGALAISKLKQKYPRYKAFTRAHGYDLFDERSPYKRQPYKEQMDHVLDRFFFISQHGEEYYITRYGKSAGKKYRLCRLGSPSTTVLNPYNNDNQFVLYSCSNVIPVKRVDLIVKALGLLKDEFPIHWVHFGDGVCMDKVQELAEQLLSKSTITYDLKGHQSLDTIYEFLEKQPVDCMITTSESEGLPVSIQEAFSYGIPLIGTAVCGIPEMMRGTGVLLSADPEPEEIAKAIKHMYMLPEKERLILRQNCRKEWEEKYCAEKNAARFVQELLAI